MKFSRRIAIIGLIWGLVGQVLSAADLRVGLLGPSRDDPHWQFFKRGLAEASAEGKGGIEWIDVTAWQASPEAQQRAAAQLATESLDAVVVWPLEVDLLAEARMGWLVNEVPVYTLERALLAGESLGHIEVNWAALSAAVHVVAVDLSPRPEGRLVLLEPEREASALAFERGWSTVFEAHPSWPATGAWSWVEADEEELPRHFLATVVTPDVGRVWLRGGFPDELRGLPKVALAIDSFGLSSIADGSVQALVVPHMAEGARWLVERLRAGESAPHAMAVGPLVVAKNNASGWLKWWQKWER